MAALVIQRLQRRSPLHSLPDELQMQILSLLPSQSLTLLSMSSSAYYHLLRFDNPLWASARKLYPDGHEVPGPPNIRWLSANERERWWAYWLFSGGRCVMCDREVFLLPAIIALRVHVCNDPACIQHFFDMIVPVPYRVPANGLSLSGPTSGHYPLVPHPFRLSTPLGSSRSFQDLLKDFCSVDGELMGLLLSCRDVEEQCNVGLYYILCRTGDRGGLTLAERRGLYEHLGDVRQANKDNRNALEGPPPPPTCDMPFLGKIKKTMFHFGCYIPAEVLKTACSALRSYELSVPERLGKYNLTVQNKEDKFISSCQSDQIPLHRMEDVYRNLTAWYDCRNDAIRVRRLIEDWKTMAVSSQNLVDRCRVVQQWWTGLSNYSGLIKLRNDTILRELQGDCLAMTSGTVDSEKADPKLPSAMVVSAAHTNNFSKVPDYRQASFLYRAKVLRDANILLPDGQFTYFTEEHALSETTLRCYYCHLDGLALAPCTYDALKQHMKEEHGFVDMMRLDVLLPEDFSAERADDERTETTVVGASP